MRDLPILFSGPMVRAIPDGRKTVTRRVMKPQPPARNGIVNAAYCGHPKVWLPTGSIGDDTPGKWLSPYGGPGDRLYVRETTEVDEDTSDSLRLSRYAADKAPCLFPEPSTWRSMGLSPTGTIPVVCALAFTCRSGHQGPGSR